MDCSLSFHKCVFAHSVRFKRLTCACSRICNCLYSLYVLCRQGGTFTFKNYFENYSAVSCGSFPYRLCLDVQNKNIDSGRKKLWLESINLFKLSPIIGISNGNIVLYSAEYSNGALEYSYHKSDLHNGFLTILVSTGIIGFVLFGIFGFRFAKHSAQHLFLQKKTYRDDVYPCLFAFLFAYLIFACFEKALLYDISFMVVWFWLIMGYMSCYITKFEPTLESQYLFHGKRLRRVTRTML